MALTLAQAKEILAKHCTEEHLFHHALAVSAAMGAMAEHFQGDVEHWQAIGYLHDVDYQEFPAEHCLHVEELLAPEGVSPEEIRTIMSHGWGLCCDVEPKTDQEKSLFTVDELTGLINACAIMRPSHSVMDMELKSIKKKYKQHTFAAGVNRTVIENGCQMLELPLDEVITETLMGMREVADSIGLGMAEA